MVEYKGGGAKIKHIKVKLKIRNPEKSRINSIGAV
jgi:hypothetical protein